MFRAFLTKKKEFTFEHHLVDLYRNKETLLNYMPKCKRQTTKATLIKWLAEIDKKINRKLYSGGSKRKW